MSKNVTFLQGNDLSVVEVEVGAADGRSGDFEYDIIRLRDVWDGCIDDAHIHCAEPCQSFHGFTAGASLVLGMNFRRNCSHSLQG